MPHHKSDPLNFLELPEETMISQSDKFYHNVKRRRTVRDFSDKPVPSEVIKNALRAAGTAPSGANMQPWHFVVISDPVIKSKIRAAAEKEEMEFYRGRASAEWLNALKPLGTDQHKPFLETASHLIVIFLKKRTLDNKGVRHKNYYTSESVGIATGLLITALHFSGVATLTHTPSPMRFLNEVLDRPLDERAYMILVAGYPAEGALVPRISKYDIDEIATFI